MWLVCVHAFLSASIIDIKKKIVHRAIGISPAISMTLMQFVSAVGDLKLRGTASLLRFPTSVKEYLFING